MLYGQNANAYVQYDLSVWAHLFIELANNFKN